jgi:deazaflavin-dependent oxidoreductase (nitroreductase family)
MSVTHSATPLPRQRPSLAHRLIGWFNPLLVRFSGSRWLPLWSKLEHQGRKSGRTYMIPVAARRLPDGFLIPMPFGEKSDWVRNVLASGRLALIWKGRRYEADAPEIVDSATAAPAFDRVQRVIMRRIGIVHFLRVRTTTV